MQEPRSERSGIVATLAGVGAVAVCCGAPLLLVAIASLGISGAALAGAAPIAGLLVVAALLVAGGVVFVRRRSACAAECEPAARTSALDLTGTSRP